MFMYKIKIKNKTHHLSKLEFIKKKAIKEKSQQKEKPLHFPLHLFRDRARSQFLHLNK